jgi:hypothetical protein
MPAGNLLLRLNASTFLDLAEVLSEKDVSATGSVLTHRYRSAGPLRLPIGS